MVVEETKILWAGGIIELFPGNPAATCNKDRFGGALSVADVVEILVIATDVEVPESISVFPQTSQSPAVNDMLVIFAATVEVREIPDPVEVINSPTLPAFALLLVVVPTMPEVWEGVKFPVEERLVKLPAAATVPPIAGGLAR